MRIQNFISKYKPKLEGLSDKSEVVQKNPSVTVTEKTKPTVGQPTIPKKPKRRSDLKYINFKV